MEKKKLTISEIMHIENKIIDRLNYRSGGYYKDQSENQNIYKAVKKKFENIDITHLKPSDFKVLEWENYHSLGTLLRDLKKLQLQKLKEKKDVN